LPWRAPASTRPCRPRATRRNGHTRLTQDGRVSITGRTLITTQPGSRSEYHLPDDAAVLTAYRDHFGIVLDEVPHAPA
jgi:hypothetical protein